MNEFLTLANQLADAAGAILRSRFSEDIPIERKSDASPVTQADREAEAAMRALIEAAYPAHGIVGEEYGNVREEAEYQWVLDPIDGTRAFISGFPLFTTLIALTKNNVPVLGIIDQPILAKRWSGTKGEPSMLNGNPLKTRATATLAQALVTTTSTYYFTPDEEVRFENLRKECASSQLGGDAYAYSMLASGRIDLVVDAGMKPYDFCALVSVIEGAGGVITDWQGKPVGLDSKGDVLAAANPALHAQALSILQG